VTDKRWLGATVATGRRGETTDPDAVQSTVDAWFDTHTHTWLSVYEGEDLSSVIYRARRDLALAWVNDLHLPAAATVLELGCGTGLTSTALAAGGLSVIATDRTIGMLLDARRQADDSRVGLDIAQVDAHALAFSAAAFDLLVALGVVPWLHSPRMALVECARVVRPGGYLVVSADNRARLVHLLDPRFNPLLARTRARARSLVGRAIAPGLRHKLHWPWEFNSVLESVGFECVMTASIGFGPFTLLGQHVLSATWGLELHRRLQQLADQHRFGLRWAGSQYVVLARKREAGG
jgi:SAM-dependent methyltransferase